MNNQKLALPKKNVSKIYSMVAKSRKGSDTITTTTSQGDPTNTCTTILTTTHFI
ncbi:hypothetical protein LX99_04239 [Mucilaginibacter oryzae]|uniref:Uncharacterized protein n=1 Tax=Mucilaginibacter oryzae TaxID=468058 RepID=A0A316H2F3_9SPHI|nr:hypothetical protein LX99_04239 [Mucilaginibacter oryzae]